MTNILLCHVAKIYFFQLIASMHIVSDYCLCGFMDLSRRMNLTIYQRVVVIHFALLIDDKSKYLQPDVDC